MIRSGQSRKIWLISFCYIEKEGYRKGKKQLITEKTFYNKQDAEKFYNNKNDLKNYIKDNFEIQRKIKRGLFTEEEIITRLEESEEIPLYL